MGFIDTIAGASTTWPIPGTMAFLTWARDLINTREVECSGTYGNTYYIGFGTNNSATGADSGANIRLCSGVHDINNFIATVTGNARFLLRNNNRWKLPAGSGGILVTGNRITIGAFVGTSGGHPPWLDGFRVPYGMAGWSDSTARGDALTNVWSRAETNPVYWVRAGASGTFESYLQFPYIRWISGSNGQLRLSGINGAPSRSFLYQSGTLFVNIAGIPSGELRTLEPAVASGCGIDTTNIDLFCVDGLRLTGFGMETDNSQNYQIRCRQVGTNRAVIKNNQLYWGSHHILGHYGGPYLPYSGGITTIINNQIGLSIQDNAGGSGGTLFVDYNSSGSQESYAYGNQFTHGALKSYGTADLTVQPGYGQAMYTHTNGVTKVGFIMWMNNQYYSHPTNKLGGPAQIAIDAMPAVTFRRNWSEYRGYIIGDECIGNICIGAGNFEPFGVNFLRINGLYRFQALTSGFTSVLSTTKQVGVAINQIIDFDYTTASGIAAGGVFGIFGLAQQHDFDAINCLTITRTNQQMYQCMTNNQANPNVSMSGVEFYNSAFIAYGGGSTDGNGTFVNMMNRSPWTGSGGASHCAYYGVRPNAYSTYFGYDSTFNPLTLVTPPNGSYAAPDERLMARGGNLPSGMYCEFDIYGRQRPVPSGCTIGPIESFVPQRRTAPVLR